MTNQEAIDRLNKIIEADTPGIWQGDKQAIRMAIAALETTSREFIMKLADHLHAASESLAWVAEHKSGRK